MALNSKSATESYGWVTADHLGCGNSFPQPLSRATSSMVIPRANEQVCSSKITGSHLANDSESDDLTN